MTLQFFYKKIMSVTWEKCLQGCILLVFFFTLRGLLWYCTATYSSFLLGEGLKQIFVFIVACHCKKQKL